MIAVTLSAEISENNLRCVLGYLKEGDSIDQYSFPAAPYSGDKSKCTKFINEEIQKVLTVVKPALDENLPPRDISCIVTDLKEQFYADYFLKELVYKNYAGMIGSERLELITANQKIHENMLENVIEKCVEESLFKSNFHNSFKSLSPQTMYCLRRYIIEKDLIDTRKIKVNLNPLKINLAGIKCKPLVKVQFEHVENEFKSLFGNVSQEKVQCMIGKFQENKYGDIIVAIKLLKDFKITDYQVKKYRVLFEKMMDNFSVIVKDC